MELKRSKKKIDYEVSGFLYDCDNKNKILVKVEKYSPLGMTVNAPRGSESILGDEVIVVTDNIVMYADVVGEKQNRNLSKTVVLSSRRFNDNIYAMKYEKEIEAVNYDEFDIVDVEDEELKK